MREPVRRRPPVPPGSNRPRPLEKGMSGRRGRGTALVTKRTAANTQTRMRAARKVLEAMEMLMRETCVFTDTRG